MGAINDALIAPTKGKATWELLQMRILARTYRANTCLCIDREPHIDECDLVSRNVVSFAVNVVSRPPIESTNFENRNTKTNYGK